MVDAVLAKSFENIGAEYDRFRPGFPAEAAKIILPEPVGTVLDLGAGTGKFTELLENHVDRVIAVEPSAAMLDILRAKLPGAVALAGSAERIPSEDASVDAVTVAQAFHWFDREQACAEISRVLVPGGVLGLVWNHSDPACAWDRAAHRVAHPAVTEVDATTQSALEQLPGFVFLRREEIRWQESITREDYIRRWWTVSSFIVADERTRAEMTDAVERILDADPGTRGQAAFDLPQVTDVFVYRRA